MKQIMEHTQVYHLKVIRKNIYIKNFLTKYNYITFVFR